MACEGLGDWRGKGTECGRKIGGVGGERYLFRSSIVNAGRMRRCRDVDRAIRQRDKPEISKAPLKCTADRTIEEIQLMTRTSRIAFASLREHECAAKWTHLYLEYNHLQH